MQCTEVGFTSFLSSGFSIATAVHCSVADKNCHVFYRKSGFKLEQEKWHLQFQNVMYLLQLGIRILLSDDLIDFDFLHFGFFKRNIYIIAENII